MPDYNEGFVTGLSSTLILIDNDRFFLGEQKATDIGVGDKVEWMHNGGSFLTHLVLVSKADGRPAPAPKTKTTKDQGPPPQTCVMGECQDKAEHFVFHKQRNRWECNLQGVDNPNISYCPLVPKKVTGSSSEGYDEKAQKAGFGTPAEESQLPVQISGIYRGNSKDMIMLTVDGKNNAYSANRELIHYLNSKDCKAKPDQLVTLTMTEKKDGSGLWATAIGPAPEGTTSPVAEQKSPVHTTVSHPAESPLPQTTEQQDTMHVPADVVLYPQQRCQLPSPMTFDEDQIALIKSTVAKDCTNTEFKLLMYLAGQYHLDPIRKQIWAVKYGDAPASIFTGRDGFLAIAHRSGHLDGMKSGVKEIAFGDKTEMVGWCEIWRNDMSRPFYVEVFLSDYQQPVPRSGKPTLWQKMPRVMIQKVAESTCLRRAFSITGLYSPEEMEGGA